MLLSLLLLLLLFSCCYGAEHQKSRTLAMVTWAVIGRQFGFEQVGIEPLETCSSLFFSRTSRWLPEGSTCANITTQSVRLLEKQLLKCLNCDLRLLVGFNSSLPQLAWD